MVKWRDAIGDDFIKARPALCFEMTGKRNTGDPANLLTDARPSTVDGLPEALLNRQYIVPYLNL